MYSIALCTGVAATAATLVLATCSCSSEAAQPDPGSNVASTMLANDGGGSASDSRASDPVPADVAASTSDHDASDHDASDHDASDHDASDHDASDHDASDHDAPAPTGSPTTGAAAVSDDVNAADVAYSGDPQAPVDNAVTITMPGMNYDVAGTLRPGVGTIVVRNTDSVAHMMAFGHLKDGVTLDQVTASLGESEDAFSQLLAEPPDTTYGTPDLLGAGQTETVTGLNFTAGTYVLACFLTSADGMPHWQMGMVGQLVISGESATEKPVDSGTIVIDDEGITVPDGFDGHGTYLVSNSGSQPHSLSIAHLDNGTPLAQYAGHVGQAMATGGAVDGGGGVLVGGIDSLSAGQSAYLTLDLAAGHYGYISAVDMTGPELPAQSGEFDID